MRDIRRALCACMKIALCSPVYKIVKKKEERKVCVSEEHKRIAKRGQGSWMLLGFEYVMSSTGLCFDYSVPSSGPILEAVKPLGGVSRLRVEVVTSKESAFEGDVCLWFHSHLTS
jgi:hypothetical protein